MRLWPRRRAAAKICFLGFLLLLMYAIRVVNYVTPTIYAREGGLKQDLLEMRMAIDNFTLEHQNPPQSLQDLVESQYLRRLPVDPMTGRSDWVIQREPVELVPDIFVVGLTDVHSASSRVSTAGLRYDRW